MSAEKRTALAVLGRRLERWDILYDLSLPIEERKHRLMLDIQSELNSLDAIDDEDQDMDVEMDELIAELEQLEELENDETAAEELRSERKAHYSDLIDALALAG